MRALTVLLLLGLVGPAWAQEKPAPSARQGLPPEVQQRVQPADTSLAGSTRLLTRSRAGELRAFGGRLDAETGVARAAYHIHSGGRDGSSPVQAARTYLRKAAPAFGWAPDLHELEVESIRTRPHSRHVTFRQVFRGVPLYQRQVKVSLNRSGQPSMVISGYAPHLEQAGDFDPRPSLTASAAAGRLQVLGEEVVQIGSPELVVYPASPPRLAWRFIAWTKEASTEWDVLVDAHSGDLIQLVSRTMHSKGRGGRGEREKWRRKEYKFPSPLLLSRTDGSGYVFIPDPLSTAGATYGGSYQDDEDADAPALDAERRLVALQDITRGVNGGYHLEGPYVRIVGQKAYGGTVYHPPVESSPDAFRYRRSQEEFEAVNAYYHIDKSQRYVQQLGFTDLQDEPIRVNPQALEGDYSQYHPELNFIEFGKGGVDDAEDASVIWHEYAHSLLEAAAPGLRSSYEGQALHEGWADYWAASYVRSLVEQEAVRRTDWRVLFKWDSGDGALWSGRTLDKAGVYPQDTHCDDGSPCDVYEDGRFWATTLMDIYTDLGRTVTDRLNLASHAYLSHPVTFRDAAEALVQADRDLYGGRHLDVLIENLEARGLVEAQAYPPTLRHDPLASTEQTGSAVEVRVQAYPAGSPIDSVKVIYGTGASPQQTLLLQPEKEDTYAGMLPLPDEAATVHYYVEAVDDAGQRVRLPAGAPENLFRFEVGPDEEPPEIAHEPVEDIELARWPVQIIAEVSDALGIDSAGVRYAIERPDGTTEEGRFGLKEDEGATYRGTFPVPITQVQPGSRVRYRLYARDSAEARNEATAPASGWYAFDISSEGMLRAYDFEGGAPGIQAAGLWARGRPTYGVKVARSGQRVMATRPDTAYAGTAQRSSLTLSALNLQGMQAAYLVFWHWYDFEHAGAARPDGSSSAVLWDAGNVKVSTDGGASWQVARPEHGYNGTVARGRGNPLAGEPGFGGYSYSWRRVVVPLPTAEDVRIRFDAGLDDRNAEPSLYYAGWYLDDVVITTDVPQDQTPPIVSVLPPPLLARGPHQGAASIAAEVQDDVGVIDVLAVYQMAGRSGKDTIRLAMSGTDRRTFRGLAAPKEEPLERDMAYRLHLRDAAGNAAVYPAREDEPLRIEWDGRPPVVARPLPAVVARSAGQEGLAFSVQVDDDTNVAEAVLEYDGFEQGTLPLSARPEEPGIFQGRITLSGAPAVGDSLTYRLRLRDVAGNETVYPRPEEPPLLIRYRNTRLQDALKGARAVGAWQRAASTWIVQPGPAPNERSSLVLEPVTLPENGDALRLVLTHQYDLSEGQGGNVKVSADGGKSWQVLSPEAGYDTTLAAPSHPMGGEDVFSGRSAGTLTSLFDLTEYAGASVRLRIDFGAARELEARSFWSIQQARYRFATTAESFTTRRSLVIHPNYPDPFASITTFSYTLPDASDVRIEVYDVLGRRVDVLVDERKSAGTHTVNYDGSRLASGLYLLRLVAGRKQKVERMIVTR